MKIRKASEKDLFGITKIELSSGDRFREENLKEEKARTKRYFDEGNRFFIVDKMAYASISIRGYICEVTRISVLKKKHGKGIETKLINFIEKFAEKEGCNSIIFWVNNQNYPAIALYSKLGYQVINLRSGLFHGRIIKKLIMKKEI